MAVLQEGLEVTFCRILPILALCQEYDPQPRRGVQGGDEEKSDPPGSDAGVQLPQIPVRYLTKIIMAVSCAYGAELQTHCSLLIFFDARQL